ncbi:DUF4397 domain-containing protein [Flavihumibacter sp. CACIAM 22H1]|uniref:DUF4397 domain-containing protein n=1 Tax=Flavihumibacter sp. CACIAM 22H1 TaxID=1812911 RepID=UPI0007A7F21A|nr:DUF4397 domain-containing protein [Flavihumibacter sp. CACIAM 22H1]KYP14915.1 MAG: hypothetical protein A1D16_03345 [Flavihumibacter sp. CACIAM 22H1]
MRWKSSGIPVLLMVLLLAGCLKQEDKTGTGPRARLLLVNAALDADKINLVLDGSPVAAEDLPFGSAGELDGNGYIPVRPGIRTIGWKVGEQVYTDNKFLPWNANAYYTVLVFDTARNGFGSWTIIQDKPETTDTSARIRFINCVAGPDSLSVWLISPEDTLVVASKRAYLERTGITATDFSVNVVPGNWRYELLDRNNQVLDGAAFPVVAGSLYSFIGIGETGSTGEKRPRLLPILQKK